MSQPAARVGDMHTCPMLTPAVPPIPHLGGPVLPPGEVRTLIGGMPAARVGDLCTCVGPPDSIAKGSPTVMIGGRPAARLGDTTLHGGVIVAGYPLVLIGNSGAGSGAPATGLGRVERAAQRAALVAAAESGAAFCEECEAERRPAPAPPAPATAETAAQRAALKAAADTGAAFCEECERARQQVEAGGPAPPSPATQRAVLLAAAHDGTPFCEECSQAGQR